RAEAEGVPGVPARGQPGPKSLVDPALGVRVGGAVPGGRVEARSRHGAGSAPGGGGASTRAASILEPRQAFRPCDVPTTVVARRAYERRVRPGQQAAAVAREASNG